MGFWQNKKIEKLQAEIDRLRAENEKLAQLSAKASQEASQLRAALKPFADNRAFVLNGPEMKEALRAAAAALKETGE